MARRDAGKRREVEVIGAEFVKEADGAVGFALADLEVAVAEILPGLGTMPVQLLLAQAFQAERLGRRAAAGDHAECLCLAQDNAQIQQRFMRG